MDVVAPSANELSQIADQFKLKADFINDALDSKHLPKYEKEGDCVFMVIRHYDLESGRNADSTTKLTRKIAMVITPSLLLTIHRKDQPFFKRVAEQFQTQTAENTEQIALSLLNQAMQTFESQIEIMEKKLEALEDSAFHTYTSSKNLSETHRIIRRLSVFKRILMHSATVLYKWSPIERVNIFKELKEFNDHMIFFSDELLEDAHSLLQLHLSLASFRTGETMRILTLFSAFFMPLTFIVGIYGMNFKFMPELEWPLAYLGIWIVMGIVTFSIAAWFYKRGWLVRR